MKKIRGIRTVSFILAAILVASLTLQGCRKKPVEVDSELDISDQVEASEQDSIVEVVSEVTISEKEDLVEEQKEYVEEVETSEENLRTETEEEETDIPEENTEDEDALTPTQLTSICMLNYMTVLTQEINNSKNNQIFLESARTSLYNDTNLKAVDAKTQGQIKNLVGIIDEYRMVDVKRERLQYIYEQNQAKALRQVIPNAVGLLGVVQSKNWLQAAVSVLYMAADSATSYEAAATQAEMQFIKEGWELDDEETKILQDSTTAQFDYMCNMVRDYDLPDEYVVRDTDVKTFVEWSNKTNLVQKIDWFEANESVYQKFGPYWLELVKDYYEDQEYQNCIDALKQYEAISAKITRKDGDYANAIPMVIISSKEVLPKSEYIEVARKYCSAIMENTGDEDWAIRYFTAQVYLDLYSLTNDKNDLNSAYDIAYYNVNTLVDEQKKLNKSYLEPTQKIKAGKDATKRAKKEIKQYNRLLKKERKVAAPPVSEALYLNCDLLFALADIKGISESDRDRIENLLHENDEDLFLTKIIDDKFRKNSSGINSSEIDVSFDGKVLKIPVTCYSDRSFVKVSINGNTTETIDDWEITKVSRPKKADYTGYTVTLKSKTGKDYKYQPGDKIVISVVSVAESPDETVEFTYEVVSDKKLFVFNGIEFERK